VDDVVYVYGGRSVDGKDLGDLGAFKISSTFEISSFGLLGEDDELIAC
jgi:hypothetical protein